MFKNLTLFRIQPSWSASLEQIESALDAGRFVPCGSTQAQSDGWVAPRGTAHGVLAESVGGQWLLKLMSEQRVLPGSVVKRRADELAAQIEQSSGHKPGKKQTKELREQAQLELLPQAFTKQSTTLVWIDPQAKLLAIDSSSANRTENIITLLVKALEGFAITPVLTHESPAAVMSAWLLHGEPPVAFTVDRECELKSSDEMKSVVRYARHPLDIDEVRLHITQGKLPTKLALTWAGRVSLLLTDTMQLKKIELLDVVLEGQAPNATDQDASFDADIAIATGELAQLIPELIEALGGEQLFGQGPAPTPAAVPQEAAPAVTPSDLGGGDDLPPW
ncbi:recombination-associated protein RdgC [Leptothrix ochracea]|uniref:recombination-associated protein RdgC n=1 Tax=Leptothrix ochracea TaxID=735331 RepID=UPI0034E26C1E